MKKTAVLKSASRKSRGSGPAPDGSEPAVLAGGADVLPGKKEIAAAQAAVRTFMSGLGRVRAFLDRLGHTPPQVLLLEGGTADERLAAAHYWILLLNCPEANGRHGPAHKRGAAENMVESPLGAAAPEADAPAALPGADAARKDAPCLECPDCIRMLTHLHRDCFFFDGLAGSIKIDEVRAMRAVLGEPAREARFRVVILREAQSLVEAAANALLKSLEDPRPDTSFLLLTPQRERLLPTLASRSFVLTLPWPKEEDARRRDLLAPWEAALSSFMLNGRGLFERSGGKGAVDAALVHDVAGLCRRALVGRIRALQSGAPPGEGLESPLARLPAQRLRILDEALAECQDSLMCNVNPVLALEWLATRMFLLLPRPSSLSAARKEISGKNARVPSSGRSDPKKRPVSEKTDARQEKNEFLRSRGERRIS